MKDTDKIEHELSKVRAERSYRFDNWGGQGFKGEDELKGFARALEWVLEPESDHTHPPSGWLTLRERRDDG